MNVAYRFVHPVDSLSLRGNRLFGEAGSYGESTFPPRPAVLAGAFRSLLLTLAGAQFDAFAAGKRLVDPEFDRILGLPTQPGDFAVTGLFPAVQSADGTFSALLPLPGDLLAFDDGRTIRVLEPSPLPAAIAASTLPGLPCVPLLRQPEPAKPDAGYLLSAEGVVRYLAGQLPAASQLVRQAQLWAREARIGVGIDRRARTAEDGKLFTAEHVVPRQPEHGGCAVGLAVGIAGCGDRLPQRGWLRIGGDGRAGTFEPMPAPSFAPPLDSIRERFKVVLLTPGLFEQGWLPNGVEPHAGGWWLRTRGVSARLVCAAVPRFEVVSGWDLATSGPKAAERAVPSGAVYWFDSMDGDPRKLADWIAGGLWADNASDAPSPRRAEGFNNALLAAWPSR